MNTPPNKSSKAITPSVKTIEVNLAVSCGLAGRATRPSRQTKKTTERLARPTLATQAGVKTIEVKLVVSRGSLALPPGQADQKTTELTARPTLATQAGRQLYAMHFYGFARLGIWRTIWDGLGM